MILPYFYGNVQLLENWNVVFPVDSPDTSLLTNVLQSVYN